MRDRSGLGRWAPAVIGATAIALATAGVVVGWTRSDPDGGRVGMPERRSALEGSTTASVGTAPPTTPAAVVPSSSAPPDPAVLADGTYPTYVRGVDVHRATVTVDVIQTFMGREAVRAAMEDGLSRRDAHEYRYWPVYVRNENALLRTLPVSREVAIRFVGECESPGTRTAALRALRRAVTPFDTTYYYSVTVAGGSVVRIVQHVAVPAC
ncbi:hypothetical protein HRbin12_01873 [bacterium HR12]|nr:hypothetical protein HRbin12_01873 [bacterium HR12]